MVKCACSQKDGRYADVGCCAPCFWFERPLCTPLQGPSEKTARDTRNVARNLPFPSLLRTHATEMTTRQSLNTSCAHSTCYCARLMFCTCWRRTRCFLLLLLFSFLLLRRPAGSHFHLLQLPFFASSCSSTPPPYVPAASNFYLLFY